MRIRPFIPTLLAALLLPFGAAAEEVVVAPGPGALAAAIRAAAPGDVLRLRAGNYSGPVTIDRTLTLAGASGSVVAGPGQGTVITVDAPDVHITGLTVTGAGPRLDTLDSGIALTKAATGAVIDGNRLERDLIGIDVQGAHNATVRGNVIVGRDDLRVPERGPGIYVWNAPGLLVEGNRISKGRDGIFVTTSKRATYRANVMENLRYAFHSMYANDIVVENNVSRGNAMGFAFMYSRGITASGNLSDGDRDHGIFMNFANRAVLRHNSVVNGGTKCLFIYNSNHDRFEDNLFEGCEIGVHFTAGSQGDVLTGNAFIGNRTQVKYVSTKWYEWSEAGRGNYWSDNAGFDVNGDGIADSPYRPNGAIDRLIWSQPMARLLVGAPAVQIIRWSQSRFPGLTPGGVVDSAPLMAPGAAGVAGAEKGDSNE